MLYFPTSAPLSEVRCALHTHGALVRVAALHVPRSRMSPISTPRAKHSPGNCEQLRVAFSSVPGRCQESLGHRRPWVDIC